MPKESTLFQKNVELWARSWPKEAVMVGYVNTNTIKECTTKKGEQNLRKDGFYLHSQKGAQEEAQQWFAKLDLDGVSHLIVFGVGLGYYYHAAEKWLKKQPGRALYFLEDDLAVIHKLLETEQGNKLLKNPLVHLIYIPNLQAEETFEILYWHISMAKLAITSLNSYAKHKQALYEELRHKIAYDASLNNGLLDEFLRYGVGFHLNFYQNLLHLPKASLGNDLFDQFYRVPAIICGAGPSLEKNLHHLTKASDKALIFAGGSSLNALTKAGIRPHFGAGIDPNPMQALRLKESNVEDLPFFYRNRMNHEAFKLIRGQPLYITGSGGFKTAGFFEKKLGIEREWVDEGHNVINFLVELATRMGCNPIIFVGMDLAFTDLKGYAAGVVADASVNPSEILDPANSDDKAIIKPDIYGKPTYTLWKWVAESEWMGKYAKQHPDIGFVNCTEGGLGFPDVPNKPFKEVEKEYLKRSYEFHNRIEAEIDAARMPKVTGKKVLAAMHELEQSLRRSIDSLDILLQDVKNEIERVKEGGSEGQSGLAALAETELMEEPAYEYVLDVFNEVIGRLLARDAHLINLKKTKKSTKLIEKLALKQRKLQFLRDVALANAELILYAIEKHKDETPKPTPKRRHPAPPPAPKGYTPILVQKEALPGTDLGNGHILKKVYNKKQELVECYIEKNGLLEGQWQLYNPDGSIKQRGFYYRGKLVNHKNDYLE